MKVSGFSIDSMVRVPLSTRSVFTQESLKISSKMERDSKSSQMETLMRDSINKENHMEKENIHGAMAATMKGTSLMA